LQTRGLNSFKQFPVTDSGLILKDYINHLDGCQIERQMRQGVQLVQKKGTLPLQLAFYLLF
jgi:hypothetical protein